MKKIKILLIVIAITFLGLIVKVNAYEEYEKEKIEYDFEYLYVTYEFISSDQYYLTYEFKPKIIDRDMMYYTHNINDISDIEYNIDRLEITHNNAILNDNSGFEFYLDDYNDYYIKFKNFISERTKFGYQGNGLVAFAPDRIFKSIRSYEEEDKIVKVETFKLTIINPEYVNLTKDDVYNPYSDMHFIEDGNKIVHIASEDYENLDKYYETNFSVEYKVTALRKFFSDENGNFSVTNAVVCMYVIFLAIFFIAAFIKINKDRINN